MQELVEQVEVDGENRVANINTSRANHYTSSLVQESKSINSVRRFSSRSSQEERDFPQNHSLHVFLTFTVEACQHSRHGVNGMTLYFLDSVSKLIDNHRDDLLGEISLLAVW